MAAEYSVSQPMQGTRNAHSWCTLFYFSRSHNTGDSQLSYCPITDRQRSYQYVLPVGEVRFSLDEFLGYVRIQELPELGQMIDSRAETWVGRDEEPPRCI